MDSLNGQAFYDHPVRKVLALLGEAITAAEKPAASTHPVVVQLAPTLKDAYDKAVLDLRAAPSPVAPSPVMRQVKFATACAAAANPDDTPIAVFGEDGSSATVIKFQNTCLTLWSASPLPRLPHRRLQAVLPSYCVIVENYDGSNFYFVGLVSGIALANNINNRDQSVLLGIPQLGGWSIGIRPDSRGVIGCGWTPVGRDSVVPPVPPGYAVQFAVDYAAGTCHVGFYTPSAVAGRFVEPPFATMQLRFVAEGDNESPARLVPTAAHSGVELFAAVTAFGNGGGASFAFAPPMAW